MALELAQFKTEDVQVEVEEHLYVQVPKDLGLTVVSNALFEEKRQIKFTIVTKVSN